MSDTADTVGTVSDPYVAAVVAHLPEGWALVTWGTEDG